MREPANRKFQVPANAERLSVVDALDALDLADKFLDAISIVSTDQADGRVIDALTIAARERNGFIRDYLKAGTAGVAS